MFYLLCLVLLADALRLRRCVQAIPRMGPPATTSATAATGPLDVEFFLAPGVALTDAQRRAVVDHLDRTGLAGVDIWPDGLTGAAVFSLLARFDPAKARRDRLVPFAGPGHAVAIRRSLLDRMGTPTSPTSLADVQRIATDARDHAMYGMDAAVLPGLAALPERAQDRRELLSLAFRRRPAAVIGAQLLLLGLVATSWTRGLEGAVFTAVFHLQVALVLAGSPFQTTRWLPYALLRTPWEVFRSLTLLVGRWPDLTDAIEAARPWYTAALAPRPGVPGAQDGPARLLGPARTTCPACESPRIVDHCRVPDLHQFKPGMFTIARCLACDHFFQNPSLTDEGLSYYYRDYYDGPLSRYADEIRATMTPIHEARVNAVKALCQPRRWLDVGTGTGQFPSVASDTLKECRFDGLDWSSAVDDAEKRGWIAKAYRGSFVDFAEVAGGRGQTWDVVSMIHYLEHTKDPAAEIAAAARVLGPGGRLFIEIPRSESRLGRALGWTWIHWAAPQHLHLPPLAVVRKWLASSGFDLEVADPNTSHHPMDLLVAVRMIGLRIAPEAGLPWQDHGPWERRARAAWHHLVQALLGPWLFLAWVLDVVLQPVLRATGNTNGLVVIARKRA